MKMKGLSSTTTVMMFLAMIGCVESAPDQTGAAEQASGGGGGLQIATTGLYVLDAPGPGEPSIAGGVLVVGSGHTAAPADTVVTLNGVVLAGGLGQFHVAATGPQPSLGPDRTLHLVASSASARQSRALDLACPASITITTTPSAGSSLAGVSTLDMSWATQFPQNAPSVINFFDPAQASLYAYDPATGAVGPGTAVTLYQPAPLSVSLSTFPTTTAYRAELRYLGIYLLDGNSGGVCGLAERFAFSN
jgi:hypothetical protein